MYKGRHCIPNDYLLLEKISRDFLEIINRDNFDINDVVKYINTFSDFDSDIASKIRFNLEKSEINYSRVTSLIDELKNNVIVDIKEHN